MASQSSYRTVPRSYDTLFKRARIVVAQMFDAACYAHMNGNRPLGGGRASFALTATRVDMGPLDVERLEAGLQSLGKRPLTAVESGTTRNSLGLLLHELIHSVGPVDPAVMADDLVGYLREPGRFFCEGLNHLATQMFYNEFVRRLGLLDAEPKLRSATTPLKDIYRKETDALRAVTAFAAWRADISRTKLVHDLVRQGFSDRPRMLLVEYLIAGKEFEQLSFDAYSAIKRNLFEVIEKLPATDDPLIACDKLQAIVDGGVQQLAARQATPSARARHLSPSYSEMRRVPVPVVVSSQGRLLYPKPKPGADSPPHLI